MADTSQLISSFVNSLETHPNGAQIIEIIQEILANDSGTFDSQLIASLIQLCNNNTSLLIDFWFLRGSILKEDGRDQESMQAFFEAVRLRPSDVSTYVRIADFFKGRDELLKVSFFLTEAQKCLNSEDIIIEEFEQTLKQLEVHLALPPGLNLSRSPMFVSPDPPSSSQVAQPALSSGQGLRVTVPSTAKDVWNLALECFEEALKENNLVYLQAFVHYAHSTIREILRLDGSFKAGLDGQLAQFGLFEYRSFFLKLNRLRNAVIHDNSIPSQQEAQDIHDRIQHLFVSFQN
jgi:tetratricopeptide (TPR) repeat protein